MGGQTSLGPRAVGVETFIAGGRRSERGPGQNATAWSGRKDRPHRLHVWSREIRLPFTEVWAGCSRLGLDGAQGVWGGGS